MSRARIDVDLVRISGLEPEQAAAARDGLAAALERALRAAPRDVPAGSRSRDVVCIRVEPRRGRVGPDELAAAVASALGTSRRGGNR